MVRLMKKIVMTAALLAMAACAANQGDGSRLEGTGKTVAAPKAAVAFCAENQGNAACSR